MAGKVPLSGHRLCSGFVDFLFLLSIAAINAQTPSYDAARTPSCDAQSGRVINGTCVRFGKIPWMVYIDLDTSTRTDRFCGGTLLDRHRVLTAAHCFVPREGMELWKRTGYVRLLQPGSPLVDRVAVHIGRCKKSRAFSQVISPKAIHLHPQFRLSSGGIYMFDAAVVELNTPAVGVSEFVNIPTGSARKLVHPGTDGKVLGWGLTEKGRTSKCLRQTDVTIKNPSYCVSIRAYGPQIFRTDSMLCAVGLGTDACSGDSGGPLLAYGNKKLIEIGIISFGSTQCASQIHPTVFTMVTAITPWIGECKALFVNLFVYLLIKYSISSK